MAIAFDYHDETDFQDREHADNATHCAQICCGGYKKLNKEARVMNETVELRDFYCDAVMYSPSLGHHNCVLLMCQLNNCTMQLKNERQITTILLTKHHFEMLDDDSDMHENRGMDTTFVAGLSVFLVTFLVFIMVLAYFGHKSATRRRYPHHLDDSAGMTVKGAGSKPYYNSIAFSNLEERVTIS